MEPDIRAIRLARKIEAYLEKSPRVLFEGELEFLNSWEHLLGAEILVPVGKQEYAILTPRGLRY